MRALLTVDGPDDVHFQPTRKHWFITAKEEDLLLGPNDRAIDVLISTLAHNTPWDPKHVGHIGYRLDTLAKGFFAAAWTIPAGAFTCSRTMRSDGAEIDHHLHITLEPTTDDAFAGLHLRCDTPSIDTRLADISVPISHDFGDTKYFSAPRPLWVHPFLRDQDVPRLRLDDPNTRARIDRTLTTGSLLLGYLSGVLSVHGAIPIAAPIRFGIILCGAIAYEASPPQIDPDLFRGSEMFNSGLSDMLNDFRGLGLLHADRGWNPTTELPGCAWTSAREAAIPQLFHLGEALGRRISDLSKEECSFGLFAADRALFDKLSTNFGSNFLLTTPKSAHDQMTAQAISIDLQSVANITLDATA